MSIQVHEAHTPEPDSKARLGRRCLILNKKHTNVDTPQNETLGEGGS